MTGSTAMSRRLFFALSCSYLIHLSFAIFLLGPSGESIPGLMDWGGGTSLGIFIGFCQCDVTFLGVFLRLEGLMGLDEDFLVVGLVGKSLG